MKRLKKATDTLSEVIFYYILIMVFGAWIFSIVEHIDYSDALYWAGVTMTTVGYGDISPNSTVGKITSVVLANVSVFFLAPLIITRMIEHLFDDKNHFSHEEQEDIKLRLKNIETLLEEIMIKK